MRATLDSGEIEVYEFEGFRLDAAKRLLFDRDGQVLPLMPKALEILVYLVRNSGNVADKDDLMDAIWPDTAVEENNLTQNISALRRVLGEKHRENRFIATIPGRGYKFVAEVRTVSKLPRSIESADRVDNGAVQEFHRGPLHDGTKRSIPYWLAGAGIIVILGLVSTYLLRWSGDADRSVGEEVKTMAVLPFKPLVGDIRDASLELGMADTLILKLNDSDNITVRPLSSVRRFVSPDQDPVTAGRALGVDAVLDGTIQSANERIRVTVKLIRVADGKQLWGGQFDERSADIFSLQDSISERLAAALRITLRGGSKKRDTDSVEAYQLYMKGRFHGSRLVLPEVQKAISYFEQAIAADAQYALPYLGIANSYRALVLTNDIRPREVMPMAKSAVLKAIELDDSLAEAHTALAMISFWYEFDWRTAEKQSRRALELDPNSAESHFAYAHLLSNLGRHDEALSEIRRARELDPVNLVTNAVEGLILSTAGRDDEALNILQATAEMDRNFWLAPLFSTRVFLKRGMYGEAIEAAKRAKDLTNGNAEATATLGFALARSGKIAEAKAVLAEIEHRAAERYVPSYTLAQLYLGLGEKDKAFALLEKSFEDRDALMVFLKVDPKWDDLRSEPRFIELMKRMNFE